MTRGIGFYYGSAMAWRSRKGLSEPVARAVCCTRMLYAVSQEAQEAQLSWSLVAVRKMRTRGRDSGFCWMDC